tara:strand:+ start:368 stop:607 length:240 start_codon:yes stop_codon:yes gene_type:complete
MNNLDKYNEAFKEAFEITNEQLNDSLEYQSIEPWDSVGHMSLMATLEDEFDIMLDMDDIVDFGSYNTGIKTLEKYGVKF